MHALEPSIEVDVAILSDVFIEGAFLHLLPIANHPSIEAELGLFSSLSDFFSLSVAETLVGLDALELACPLKVKNQVIPAHTGHLAVLSELRAERSWLVSNQIHGIVISFL